MTDDDRALATKLMMPPGDHSPEMVALLLGQSAGTILRLLAENKRLTDQLYTLTLETGKKFADLMERARDAEQQAADSQHAVQVYCDDYNKAMAERDAAIARAEKAEAFGIRAERATLILADEFEMDGDTILRLKAERDAATARADALAGEVESLRNKYDHLRGFIIRCATDEKPTVTPKEWLNAVLFHPQAQEFSRAALSQVSAMQEALEWYGENAKLSALYADGGKRARAALRAVDSYPVPLGDLILIPRDLIGAACSAIDKKRDAPEVLRRLREYTVGALAALATKEAPHKVTCDTCRWKYCGPKAYPCHSCNNAFVGASHPCRWELPKQPTTKPE